MNEKRTERERDVEDRVAGELTVCFHLYCHSSRVRVNP